MSDPDIIEVRSSGEENGEDSSSDDDSDGGHALLDLEAADSSDSRSDTDSQEDDMASSTFHPFVRLPPELRQRVWQFFCPDLTRKSRVLDFVLSPSSERHAHAHATVMDRGRLWTVKDGMLLEQQTLALRRLLAVHGESRAIALKAFPDTLSIDVAEHTVVRFHRQRDVVFLHDFHDRSSTRIFQLPGFADRICQMAVTQGNAENNFGVIPGGAITKHLHLFTNLKRIFFQDGSTSHGTRKLKWCASDYNHVFRSQTTERRSGYGEDYEQLLCWPNVDEHADFAKFQVPSLHLESAAVELVIAMDSVGVEHYPMISFETARDLAKFDALKHIDPSDEGPYSDDDIPESPDSGTDSNQYESEGIDDSEIVVQDESSEDELVPIPISDGQSSDNGSSHDDGVVELGARFSSPELEPTGNHDSDDEEASEGLARRPKRRIVSDSEDEDGVPSEPAAKRARTVHVVLSDSEDEEEAGVALQQSAARRRHIVISDSDSDGDEEDVGTRKRPISPEESNHNGDESDESDGAPPARLSLAERLSKFREENPVPDSDGEDQSSRDEDGNSLAGSSDEEDERDEEDSEDGLIDGMADDGDSESEDGADDDEW